MALHGDKAIVDGLSGPYVWSSFYGEPDDRLQAANSYALGASTGEFAKDGNLLAVHAVDPDLSTSVINIFRPNSSGKYEHVAVLKASNGQGLFSRFEIQGNTVVAGGSGKAFVFQLPASLAAPPPRYETFESGNGANWTRSAGSQFTVVRPTALNGVYRQSSAAGDARAVLGNTSWINQGIEADVRPTAFNGNDRWVGLATRYANDQNYYYVTLRSSGSVQLEAHAQWCVQHARRGAGHGAARSRAYRLRLESIGTQHRVYVNGQLLLSAEDTGPQVAGDAALIMYRAQADYDNVIVSPTPRSSIYADDFTGSQNRGDWTYTGEGQWSIAGDALTRRNSVAGDARAIIGTPVDDQVISLRVQPTAFAAGTATQERWVGLVARYVNDQNYYYVSLRNSNQLSLRKLVNGAITQIGTVPVSVAAGSTYALRLDATGTALRVYLNGTLVIQAVDSSHTKGRGGAIAYRVAAQFDDYVAYQP